MFRSSLLTRPCWRIASPLRSNVLRSPGSIPRRLNHNASPKKTVIEQYLLDRIKLAGPLPFATYMQQCLSHATSGYYMNPENSVFGKEGDFITSPEITQIFGELIAVWLISQYNVTGKEYALRIIELGPGKGTLMADILRVVLQFLPKRTVNVHLVETSLSMRATQKSLLAYNNHPNVHLRWHNSVNEISPSPSEYTMLVAHEFFDALPIHILKKAENGEWHEVLVASGIDQEAQPKTESDETAKPVASTSTGSFRYVLAPQPSPISTVLGFSSTRFKELPAGATLEVSPASFRIARKLGELLASGSPDEENPSIGGSGLIIDYGASHAFDNSLRAFQNHKIVDVFHEPGNTDLTANVDFAYLKEAMGDLVAIHGPIDQHTFLHGMGLQTRLQALLRGAKTQEQQEGLWRAASRLVDIDGMGGQYQVLGITKERPVSEGDENVQPWPFVDRTTDNDKTAE